MFQIFLIEIMQIYIYIYIYIFTHKLQPKKYLSKYYIHTIFMHRVLGFIMSKSTKSLLAIFFFLKKKREMSHVTSRGVHGPGRAGSGRAKTSKIHKNVWPEPGPARLHFFRARPDPVRL